MIDLSKFSTKTRGGMHVRNLHFFDVTKAWPIHGEWLDASQAVWVSVFWDSEGRYESGKEHDLDLVIRRKEKHVGWTKTKPTKEGWYWHKLVDKPGIHLVFKSTDEKLRVAFAGHSESKLVDECYGYWLGPLEEPEGP